MELLQIAWNFIWSALASLYALLETTSLFVWDFLVMFHVNHPRLEGLVIGIALAWFMTKRDSHPLLKAISAPLKLVVDILDLIWDHCVEFLADVWAWHVSHWKRLSGWIASGYGWCRNKVVDIWSMCTGSLRSIRDRLKKEKADEN